MARKPRAVRPEERELWHRVTDSAIPLAPGLKTPRVQTPVAVAPKPKPAIPRFKIGEAAQAARRHDLAPPPAERLAKAPVQMDKRSFGKMKRGKLSPDARIDLHGQTLAHAHPTLTRFILDAHAKGARLVLVITGKGKPGDDGGPIPVRHGVLRHQVPTWLQSPPLGALVLQITEAHLRHGGSGAYYVYLRRTR